MDEPIMNPPEPVWWDRRYEPFPAGAMPGTEQPCGCHLRQSDAQVILCAEHLADLNRLTQG